MIRLVPALQWVIVGASGRIYSWSNSSTRKGAIHRHLSDVKGSDVWDDSPAARAARAEQWADCESRGDRVIKVKLSIPRKKKPHA